MRRYLPLVASFVAGAATIELFHGAGNRIERSARRPAEKGDSEVGGDVSPPNLDEAVQAGRGRDAEKPSDIPARGWKDILLRTWKEFSDDQVPLIAAGCTFYTLLALSSSPSTSPI